MESNKNKNKNIFRNVFIATLFCINTGSYASTVQLNVNPPSFNNSMNNNSPPPQIQNNTGDDLLKNSAQLQNAIKNRPTQVNNCWDYAAKKFGNDAWMLFAIASVESSFNTQAVNQNTNKSTDIGLMQINTIHLNELSRMGISRSDLINDPCKSVIAGSYILRQKINRWGYNVDGIGAYNSGNDKFRRPYGRKVLARYDELVQRHYYRGEPFSLENYQRKKEKSSGGHTLYVKNNMFETRQVSYNQNYNPFGNSTGNSQYVTKTSNNQSTNNGLTVSRAAKFDDENFQPAKVKVKIK